MQVPIIDFKDYDKNTPATVAKLGTAASDALAAIGFMSVVNLGIDQSLLQKVFFASRKFFASDAKVKARSAYVSAGENFGYQGLCEEHLNPGAPADLKETFTMRNVLNKAPTDDRWPSKEFQNLMCEFYAACLQGAAKLQQALAVALNLDQNFFVRYHNGENVTLRLLYYPESGVDQVTDRQMGAGEHTDYGLLTLLFQDDVGGLEVMNANNQWQAVDYVESAIVVNSGDLLERWTNGRYRSTLHRVRPKIGQRERFSIVMFVDPDSATQVSVVDSCVSDQNPARYEPITAGEHVQQKLEASHKNMFKP